MCIFYRLKKLLYEMHLSTTLANDQVDAHIF